MSENPQDRHLYLVDGTSQLFRAYYAIRGLTNAQGLPTGAVYGFTSMLRKLIQEEKPPYLAVAFDLAGPTFRHDRFAEYKAHRPPAPEDLNVQAPYAKEVCRVLRIPVLEVEGYEADDLIATYARAATEAGFRVTVVASDKDLLQLVRESVLVLNPSRNLRLDARGVVDSFGVEPERVRDVLGLMGDAVDNIPGVPGVGEKTAVAMVSAYGSLEKVLERADSFVAALAGRDALLSALEVAEREPAVSGESAALLREKAAALEGALAALARREPDTERKGRIDAALDALRRFAPGAGGAGSGKDLARSARELRKALAELERGGARKAWSSVHENRDLALLSRDLATLDSHAPAVFDPEVLSLKEPDRAAARDLFRNLGFRGFLAEMGEPVEAVAGAAEERAMRHETVLDVEALRGAAEAVRRVGRVALSLVQEGDHPLRAVLVGLSLACEESGAFYVPLQHRGLGAPDQISLDAVREILGPVLRDPGVKKIGHDSKRDLHLLRRHGLRVDSFDMDTMVAAFLLDPGRTGYGIERLAQEFLGWPAAAGGSLEDERSPRDADVERLAAPSARQALAELGLCDELSRRLAAEGLDGLYRDVDGPLLPLLAEMEERGIRVDAGALLALGSEMEAALDVSRRRIQELAGAPLNPDSPKQLREVLFGKLGLAPRRKTAKAKVDSTDAATLEDLADEHEIAREILSYRELAKLKGTYVDALPSLVDADGRIHTTYDPTGAATGRISSADPNLQNIPARTALGRRIRSAFVPQPGFVFLSSDYSQMELRVLAHLCRDPELIAAFRAGEDVHRRTAARIFGVASDLVSDEMRRRAKAVNFGILYGMSESRLAREQGIPRAEARRFIQAYFDRFERVRAYIDDARESALREGRVRTLFGRLRRFPQLGGRPTRAVVEQALRAAVNTTVQGTAADLMKMAMIRVAGVLGGRPPLARMLLQVHDELLFEVPESRVEGIAPRIREAMEEVFPLEVPLAVDQKVGRSWSEVT